MRGLGEVVGVAGGLLVGAACAFAVPFRSGPPVPTGAQLPATAPRVVCTHRKTRVETSTDCEEMQTRLDWCNARLLAATRVRPTTAPPEAVGVDDPVEWDREMRHLLDVCGIPASPEATDCAEYPCVTALRAPDDAAMTKNLDACEAAGFTDDDMPALLPVPLTCGDGHVETLWLFAVADNPTLATLYARGGDSADITELALLGARRSEALAKQWSCRP